MMVIYLRKQKNLRQPAVVLVQHAVEKRQHMHFVKGTYRKKGENNWKSEIEESLVLFDVSHGQCNSMVKLPNFWAVCQVQYKLTPVRLKICSLGERPTQSTDVTSST